MLYCTNCGSELNDMVLFCANCGAEDEGTEQKSLLTDKELEEKFRELVCAQLRKNSKFSRAHFGELEACVHNANGQIYAELTVHCGGVRQRFCAVGETDCANGALKLRAGSPQRMADFAKTYLARKTMGFTD